MKTKEELNATINEQQLKKECELTEKQDEKVVAGENPPDADTLMHCEVCRYEILWGGDYLNGALYTCPVCGAHAFRGIRYI